MSSAPHHRMLAFPPPFAENPPSLCVKAKGCNEQNPGVPPEGTYRLSSHGKMWQKGGRSWLMGAGNRIWLPRNVSAPGV